MTSWRLSKSCCCKTKSITGLCNKDFSLRLSDIWAFEGCGSLEDTIEVPSIFGRSFCKAGEGLHKRDDPPSGMHNFLLMILFPIIYGLILCFIHL